MWIGFFHSTHTTGGKWNCMCFEYWSMEFLEFCVGHCLLRRMLMLDEQRGSGIQSQTEYTFFILNFLLIILSGFFWYYFFLNLKIISTDF